MAIQRDMLMREVDEEIRREQLRKLWEQHGTWLIIAAVVVLAGIGGYAWWRNHSISQAEAAGSQFEEALNLAESGKVEESTKAFAAIASGSGSNYALLAQLSLAGNAAKAGKTEDAIKAYEAAAKMASDPLIRDLARLQTATLKIDTADWTDIQNRLNDLISDSNPWRYSARELLGIAALRAGKLDDARQTLAPLSADPRAPADIRERAGALMSLVVAADLEKTAPAKIEPEKTEQAVTPVEAVAPKSAPPAGKAAPAKGAPASGK